MITTIRAKILAMLNTQIGVGKPISYVYSEHRTSFDGFPAITFEPTKMDSKEEDNVNNLRTYEFDIYIHQEAELNGNSNALDTLCAATEAIISMFDKNYTMDGVVDWCRPIGFDAGFYNEGTGLVKYTAIKLQCIKSEYIN